MAHYYFDVRDGGDLSVDDLGMELRDIEAVEVEAMRSLGVWPGMQSVRRNTILAKHAEWQLRLGTEAAPCCTPGLRSSLNDQANIPSQ
jgi:hypothetical protein